MPELTTAFPERNFSPEELLKIYDNGFEGTLYDPTAEAALYGVADTFYTALPQAASIGKGKLSTPFKFAVALDPDFGIYERQTTGDCVSHATRNGGMLDYCADVVFGETKYQGRFCTENIYGYRGHGGQGASCARLCLYTSQDGPGGFLTRQKYTSEDGRYSIDLSNYKSSIGHNWGRSGTPSWLNKIAAKNKALRVFDVTSIDEARDVIAMGFGINMCSGLGFSSSRNEDGLAEQRGRWAHAMAWVAVDDTPWAHDKYGGPLFLVQNSWGRWNGGPKRNEQPDGSFWIRPSVARSMINGRGGWAIASIRGYDRELILDRHSHLQKEYDQ